MTLLQTKHPYDEVADQYDKLWSSPAALKEDRQVMAKINFDRGDVLDIGCGTGLFLDHHRRCDGYLGIDPSSAMLEKLKAKHPKRMTMQAKFEDAIPKLTSVRFQLIVSLFGSPSYACPDALLQARSMLTTGGRLICMFIAPGYEPETHRYISNPPTLYQHRFEDYGWSCTFGNYIYTCYQA